MRAWLVVALAGCATQQPASFELDLGGLPSAVAVKANDGAWTKLAPYAIGATTTGYLIPFADTLDVMIACESDTYASLHELRTTRDELDATLAAWERPHCAQPKLTSQLSGRIFTSRGSSRIGLSAASGWDGAVRIEGDYDFAFPIEATELDLAVWDITGAPGKWP